MNIKKHIMDGGGPLQKEEVSFDLERFVKVTDQDKYNLLMLRALKRIQWYVDVKKKVAGECFHEEALRWDLEADAPIS